MTLWTLLLPAVILTLGPPDGVAPVKDVGPLEGTWRLVSVEYNGQSLPMENLLAARLTVQGERYTFTLGKTTLAFTHRVDLTKGPATLDLTATAGAEKGKTFRAICELKGDTLKICRQVQPEKERPSRFVTKPDSGLMIVVWERDRP